MIVSPLRQVTRSKWVVLVSTEKSNEAVNWCKNAFGQGSRNPKRGRWRCGWVEVANSQKPQYSPYTKFDKGVRFFFYNELDAAAFVLRFS